MTSTSSHTLRSPACFDAPADDRAEKQSDRPVRRSGPLVAGVTAVAAVAGTASLVLAYQGAEWKTGNEFTLFWTAMVVFVVPVTAMLCDRKLTSQWRGLLLVAFAAFTYLPKLLRTANGPLYHDEFAHWRQTSDLVTSGTLFAPNPIITVIDQFPGLHATVGLIALLSGSSVWTAAIVVLVVAHGLTVLGVAALASDIWNDGRVGALAAVIYALNASFLYFDTQLGYESLAIPLLVWSLVVTLKAVDANTRQASIGWGAAALMLAATTVVTHHLTTLWLVLVLALLATALSLPRVTGSTSRAGAGTAWAIAAGTATLLVTWIAVAARQTVAYLSPFLGRAFGQLVGIAGGSSHRRQLFSGSVTPRWEQLAGYAAPLLTLLAVVAAGVFIWRNRRSDPLAGGRRRAALLAMFALGASYFPSLLFILTNAGTEGARRSWAESFVGIAVVVAPAILAVLDRMATRPHRSRAAVVRAALLTGLVVVLVGNTAAGLSTAYRFPGPPRFGSDSQSMTPELLAIAEWMREHGGDGQQIVADRYSGLVLASYGHQDPARVSAGFPAYDLYLVQPGQAMPKLLMRQLSSSNFAYLVVDRRMSKVLPEVGIYFDVNEPFAQPLKPPFTTAGLAKFDALAWTIKVYDSDNFAVYRFSFGDAQTTVKPLPSVADRRGTQATAAAHLAERVGGEAFATGGQGTHR